MTTKKKTAASTWTLQSNLTGPQGPSGVLANGNAAGNTPYWNGSSWVVNSSNIFNNGGNIGINQAVPAGKLHVKGSADVSQLIVDANSTQGNSNPLIKLRNSAGTDLMWIHSDDTSNLFVGYQAGSVNNKTGGGISNTFVGRGSGKSNTTGYYNTAFGYRALYSSTTALVNTAFGYEALFSNTTGASNIAFGPGALWSNLTGGLNVAIGNGALRLSTTSTLNVAIGSNAMYWHTNGDRNIAIGSEALYFDTAGYNNIAIGISSLVFNRTGHNNTALGTYSLYSNVSGNFNMAIGKDALYYNTTGQNNTAVGDGSMQSNVSGNYNTAIGFQTLLNANAGWNTAVGYQALFTNSSGVNNVANGYMSMRMNTTGSSNTAYGTNALFSNSTASNNVAAGTSAMSNSTTGYDNVAVGFESQYNNGTGYANVAVGKQALYTTSASANNVAVGFQAGAFANHGWNNTLIGTSVDANINGYFNCTGIGSVASLTASNQVRIGNSSNNSIGGYVGWSNLSDGRYKKNVQENVKGLDFILKLRPVTYNLDVRKLADVLNEDRGLDENGNPIKKQPDEYTVQAREEKEKIIYTGFIAQEVEAAANESGFNFSGIDAPKNASDLYALRYGEFVVPLVKAVQELSIKVNELEKVKFENESLKQEIHEVKRILEQLQKKQN
ncbi:MAG TPA: tail fiber domain-containing protein [Bacteroidia bacterium]|nr:tail fiber domain-containing protein [Bacteroidia bacterium]